MNNPSDSTSSARDRLEQLERFVTADPNNLVLRRQTFDAALLARDWARAALHLAAAQEQSKSSADAQASLEWALKEGDFWLAQREWLQAGTVLQLLVGREGAPLSFNDAVLHNLAYIDFCQNEFVGCVNRLAPRFEAPQDAAPGDNLPPTSGTSQQLWLRALHHSGQTERALQWVQAAEQAQRLDIQAAAVASTIALDEQELGLALRWSAAALTHWEESSKSTGPSSRAGQPPLEALVTQAWLALTRKDGLLAAELAERALQIQPNEARALSAWGYAGLMLRHPAAQVEARFQRAIDLQPHQIDHWSGLAWSQLAQQHTALAIESLRKALALEPEFAETHGALALAHAWQGERDLAGQYLASARQIDPDCRTAHHAQQALENPQAAHLLQAAVDEMEKFSPRPPTRH